MTNHRPTNKANKKSPTNKNINKYPYDERAAILAFIPFTGPLGIHDFRFKQRSRYGIFHLVLIFIPIASPMFMPILRVNNINYWMVSIALIVSYLWAIFEGIHFLKKPSNLSKAEIAKKTLKNKKYSIISLPISIIFLTCSIGLHNSFVSSADSSTSPEEWQVGMLLMVPVYFLAVHCAIIAIALAAAGLTTKYWIYSIISFIIIIASCVLLFFFSY